MPAISKTDFLKISSSKDLLKTNSDAHSAAPLSFTFFDANSREIDADIKLHLQKFDIGIIPSKLTAIGDKDNSGLWIIEAAKALVHGEEKLDVNVKNIQSLNGNTLQKSGLLKLGEEVENDDQWEDPAPTYDPTFFKKQTSTLESKVNIKPAAAAAPEQKNEEKTPMLAP